MVKRRGQRWRQLVVWLHVITSVGWMGQAVTLVSLLAVSLADPGNAVAATTMARHLDIGLLAPLANASAFTGLLLAATTSWGLFRHWWVAAKFAITLTQLYLGIFVLSSALDATVASARIGRQGPVAPVLVGGVLMAGAIGFQAWLSIAKPWSRIPSTGGPTKLPTAPGWVFAVAAAAVCADLAIAARLGYPLPIASGIALVVAAAVRRRTVGADKIRQSRSDRSGVQARSTVLLVIVLLGVQPLLWHWILGLLGDSAASAAPVLTAFGHVLGWLGTVAMGAALVVGVCTWFIQDRRWPVKATGVLALVVCGVFAVAGLMMTLVNPTLPLFPLGLLLIGVLLWLPLAGVATAGRRCLTTAQTVCG